MKMKLTKPIQYLKIRLKSRQVLIFTGPLTPNNKTKGALVQLPRGALIGAYALNRANTVYDPLKTKVANHSFSEAPELAEGCV